MQQSGGAVTQSGLWTVTSSPSLGGTSTRTTVSPTTSSQTLIAANTGRKGLHITFTTTDQTQNIWINDVGAASSTNFFTSLKGSGELELFDAATWPYTGSYTVISDVATGTIQVRELTT